MKTNDILAFVDDKEFLDKIYQFSYRRCNTAYEAEDLCSDILCAVISAIQKQENIENFYAFVWTIAHRVYADYCEKRARNSSVESLENYEFTLSSKENVIDELVEDLAAKEQLKRIFSEIAFLSKAYRDVIVMYYIDELKVKDIAITLGIHETTVKQRLFSARNIVRKEVESVNSRNLLFKPINLDVIGTGSACGNDPQSKIERTFSKNLVYLCKDKPKTAKELSEELCIPMPYIEEELEIQCHGENSTYGMLRKLENGKYAINVLLVDYDEYEQANRIYEKHLPEFCEKLRESLKKNKEKILSFPYLSAQNDERFILWYLLSCMMGDFNQKINKVIAERYFSDIVPPEREFSCVVIAYTDGKCVEGDFYGSDGIFADFIGGFRAAYVSNIYGERLDRHFYCWDNMSHDAKILMTLRSIGGLSVSELTENEKEIAAKAIECGYLRRHGDVLEPKIIVVERQHEMDFYNLAHVLSEDMDSLIEQIAAELSVFMKKQIPKHLINEYPLYVRLIAGVRILSGAIEECIKEGLLLAPENRLGAEGVLMVVEK